ncbi:MAG: hypothetical protein FJ088_12340 [Deltaproteobacteria bacterium]|nr:hypothetical protein [Deltaproteobacteria bacterium]
MRREFPHTPDPRDCSKQSSDQSNNHLQQFRVAVISFLISVFTLGAFNVALAEDAGSNEHGHARRLPGMVLLTAEQRNAIGITTASVESTTVTPELRLLGHPAADETRVVRVNAGTDGFIHDVSPMVVGSFVPCLYQMWR